jgi:hypothetical protein
MEIRRRHAGLGPEGKGNHAEPGQGAPLGGRVPGIVVEDEEEDEDEATFGLEERGSRGGRDWEELASERLVSWGGTVPFVSSGGRSCKAPEKMPGLPVPGMGMRVTGSITGPSWTMNV